MLSHLFNNLLLYGLAAEFWLTSSLEWMQLLVLTKINHWTHAKTLNYTMFFYLLGIPSTEWTACLITVNLMVWHTRHGEAIQYFRQWYIGTHEKAMYLGFLYIHVHVYNWHLGLPVMPDAKCVRNRLLLEICWLWDKCDQHDACKFTLEYMISY